MKYKAIFCDFDGTLYRDDWTISESNKQAINKYVQRGGRFVISTGRLFASIAPHIKELGLKGEVIVSQGAEIYDIESGKKLLDKTFESNQAVVCAQFAESFDGVAPMMYIGDECFTSRRCEMVDYFAKITNLHIHYTECPISEYIVKHNAKPCKVLVIMKEDFAEQFVALGESKLGEEYYLCRSQKFLVELLKAGINKGAAVEFVCEKHAIDKKDIICVGDSENDMSMIKMAGLGVAVANAFDNVKKVAHVVLEKTNDEDAVAELIQKFCSD